MARTFATFDELKRDLANLADDDLLVVSLTPELAADILAHDPVNRRLRPGNLTKLKREIEGGFWDPRKSTPLRFLPALRLADGQHRCRAVVETKTTITVTMCLVPDTVGVDEGAARTMVDHIQLMYGFDEGKANLVSTVTKALCHVPAAGNREFLAFFKEHEPFIVESADKPLAWLADQLPVVAAVFKPGILATLRAKAIFENSEPAESVDQLLYDAINGGATAPEGSPRRALAKQFFDAMQDAYKGRKATKRQDMLKWLIAALRFEREGQLKNILTARIPGEKKRRGGKKPPFMPGIDRATAAQSIEAGA
jgi:hypothetical protein